MLSVPGTHWWEVICMDKICKWPASPSTLVKNDWFEASVNQILFIVCSVSSAPPACRHVTLPVELLAHPPFSCGSSVILCRSVTRFPRLYFGVFPCAIFTTPQLFLVLIPGCDPALTPPVSLLTLFIVAEAERAHSAAASVSRTPCCGFRGSRCKMMHWGLH